MDIEAPPRIIRRRRPAGVSVRSDLSGGTEQERSLNGGFADVPNQSLR